MGVHLMCVCVCGGGMCGCTPRAKRSVWMPICVGKWVGVWVRMWMCRLTVILLLLSSRVASQSCSKLTKSSTTRFSSSGTLPFLHEYIYTERSHGYILYRELTWIHII